MRFLYLSSLSCFATAARLDPCSTLCETEGPTICTGGSYVQNGYCHGYVYRGDPAENDFCYHTAESAATCPAGQGVKETDAARLLVFHYGEASTVENFVIDSDAGTTYSGEVLMKSVFVKPHGRGVLTFASGVTYEGEFYLGEKHGQGTHITPSGRYGPKIVTSSWKNGWIAAGPGHVIQDGNDYKGQLAATGLKNGFGTQTFRNGDVYEGSWLTNKMSGEGTLRRADGSVIKGVFKDDAIEGWATETSADGVEVYDGEFVRGIKQGFGRMTLRDGGVYEGQWKGGKMHGSGILTKPNGDMHYGSFSAAKIPSTKVNVRSSSSEDMSKFLRWKDLNIHHFYLTEYHAKANWEAVVRLVESEELARTFVIKFKARISEVFEKAIASNNEQALRNLVSLAPVESMRFTVQSSEMGDVAAVRALVLAGVDITSDAPLVAAVRGGHFEVAEALVEMGAPRELSEAELRELLTNPTSDKDRFVHLLAVEPSNQVRLLQIDPSRRIIEIIRSRDPEGLKSALNEIVSRYLARGDVAAADDVVRNGSPFPWDANILVTLVRRHAPDCSLEYVLDQGVLARIEEAIAEAGDQLSVRSLTLLLSRHTSTLTGAKTSRGISVLVTICSRREDEISIESLGLLLRAGVTVGREEALLQAASMGSVRFMELLIKFGADVGARNQKGETALILAVKNRYRAIVSVLVTKIDPNIQDKSGCSAFCWAVETKQLDMIDILARNGADVNVLGLSGVPPLVSISRGDAHNSENTDVFAALVNAGVTLGAPEALRCALRSKKFGFVTTLLSSNSLARETLETTDETSGETPLIIAIKLGHAESVNLLLGAGADPNNMGPLVHAMEVGNLNIINSLIAKGADVNMPDSHGMTPLVIAARASTALPSTMSILLNAGATAGKEDAFRASAASGRLELVRILYEKFPEVLNSRNGSDETALMLAVGESRFFVSQFLLAEAQVELDATVIDMAREASVEIIRLFINRGVDLDPREDLVVARIEDICKMPRSAQGLEILRFLIQSRTGGCGIGRALYFASDNGAENYVRLLLDTPCASDAINARGDNGETPLLVAVRKGKQQIVALLLAAGADVSARSAQGRTALDIVLGRKSLGALNLLENATGSMLLDHILRTRQSPLFSTIVQSIDASNARGETALMVAASQGNLSVVEGLIQASADVNYQSPRRESALSMALRQKRTAVVEYLLSHGASLTEEMIAALILSPRAAELAGGHIKSTATLAVNRDRIFYDSIDFLLQDPRIMFDGPAFVNFVGENGVDAGGLRREWLSAVPRNIFEDLKLFAKNNDENFVDFDRSLQFDERIYTAFGRFLGMALLKSARLPVALPSMFYSKLLGREITFAEFSNAYPARADELRFLERISSQDTEMYEDFSVPELGGLKTFSGVGVEGSYPSASQLLDEIINSYFSGPKMESIRNGFNDLVPIQLLRERNVMPSTLADMIFGAQIIDGSQIATNLALRESQGAAVPRNLFAWLQEWLQSADQTKLRNFVRFVTASPQVPTDGFTGANAIKVATWPAGLGEDRYPHAHTCFATIDLPEAVTDQQEFVRNLEIAIQTTGFGAA